MTNTHSEERNSNALIKSSNRVKIGLEHRSSMNKKKKLKALDKPRPSIPHLHFVYRIIELKKEPTIREVSNPRMNDQSCLRCAIIAAEEIGSPQILPKDMRLRARCTNFHQASGPQSLH